MPLPALSSLFARFCVVFVDRGWAVFDADVTRNVYDTLRGEIVPASCSEPR